MQILAVLAGLFVIAYSPLGLSLDLRKYKTPCESVAHPSISKMKSCYRISGPVEIKENFSLNSSDSALIVSKSGSLLFSQSTKNVDLSNFTILVESSSTANPIFKFHRQNSVKLIGLNFVNSKKIGKFYKKKILKLNKVSDHNDVWIIRSEGVKIFYVQKNQFESTHFYSSALIKVNSSQNVKFQENYIKGFHGGVYVSNSKNIDISVNTLKHVSFNAVDVSKSSNIKITNNKIFFPGNGSAGDGITADTNTNLNIAGNLISNSSCYGVWISGNSKKVRFNENTIQHGLTSALYVSPVNDRKTVVEDLEIKNNFFIANNAWGLVLAKVKGGDVKNNYFGENGDHSKNKKQYLIYSSEKVVVSDNTNFRKFEAKDIKKSPIFGGFYKAID